MSLTLPAMNSGEEWDFLTENSPTDIQTQLSRILDDSATVTLPPLEFQFASSFVSNPNSEQQSPYDGGDLQSYGSLEDMDSSNNSVTTSSVSPVSKRGGRTNLRRSIVEKKRRHLDLEINRRQKMNDKYQELCTLCRPVRKDKASILESATDRLKEHNSQVQFLLASLNPESFN
jgi:hypothetical protein